LIEDAELSILQNTVKHQPVFKLMHFHHRENKCPTMFNFTKKCSNALVDMNGQADGVTEKYNAAIKKIERLEDELSQKNHELNQSCKAQQIMTEGVRNCVTSLYTVQNQLQGVVTHLELSNKHIAELKQKNRLLKSSGDEWFKRAIKLEFEVLASKDELKKVVYERDLAIKMCEMLHAELTSADKENGQRKNQG
jgi:uncharacterized coiled-coil DUF342 family protein